MTIKIPNLIHQLKNAEDEAEYFADRFCGLESNPGVQYLYQSVLRPLLNNQPVSTGDLDMDSFDQEDINILFSVYSDNFTCNSKDFSRLSRIYQMCSKSPAKPVPVYFL